MSQSKAWSFSRLKDFKTCPMKYLEVKVLKHYQEPLHPTTDWGTRGHLALELRVRDGTPLPPEFAYLEPIATGITAIPGLLFCEHELAVTKDKTPTGFDADDAWARGIVDVFKFRDTEAVVLDYKFGKVRPTSQLKLMALLVFATYPTVQTVKTRFLWLAHRDKTDATFHRADMATLWQEFEQDAAQLEQATADGVFIPRPSGLCRSNPKTGYAGCVVTSCEFYGKGSYRYG